MALSGLAADIETRLRGGAAPQGNEWEALAREQDRASAAIQAHLDHQCIPSESAA